MDPNTLGVGNSVVVSPNTSGMQNETGQYLDSLDNYNAQLLTYQLPAIIYSGLMMLVGLPGNMVVFYVYFFKWRRSTSRMFILFLAALDMINCATTIPMEIFIMRFSVKLDTPFLCKLSRFSTYTMNSSSALILVGIATDRFKRICRPYQKSFSEDISKYICIGAIVFSISSTWPSLVLYGTRTVDLGKVNGQACLLENIYDSTPYPIIFFGMMGSMTLMVFATLSILYYFVGLQIYRHRHFKMRNCTHVQKIIEDRSVTVKSENNKSSNDKSKFSSKAERDNDTNNVKVQGMVIVNDTNEDNDDNMLKPYQLTAPEPSHDPGTSCGLLNVPYNCRDMSSQTERSIAEYSTKDMTAVSHVMHDNEMPTVNETQTEIKVNEVSPSRKSNSPKRQKPKVRRRTRKVRYLLVRGSSTLNASGRAKCTSCLTVRIGKSTLMLFLITIAYVFSFLPFYIIAIVRQSDETFVRRLSNSGYIAYHVFLRSYLLSSAINPIIYSFCNVQFREYCFDLFRRILNRNKDHFQQKSKFGRR